VVDIQYPQNEEEIVSEIMRSDEFKSWDTSIYYRFLGVHQTSDTTPVNVIGNYNGEFMEELSYADEHDFFDLLIALSTSFNL
jgi:hypothetical protein